MGLEFVVIFMCFIATILWHGMTRTGPCACDATTCAGHRGWRIHRWAARRGAPRRWARQRASRSPPVGQRRPEITQFLVDILNAGVTPFVCQKGSVGACGDLAPMSQIALLLMGEGKAYLEGELLD